MTQTGPTSCPSVTPVEIGGAASAPTQPWLRWRSSSPCGDEKEWRLRTHSQKRANTESKHTSRSQQRNRPPWRHAHRSLPRHLHSLPAGEAPAHPTRLQIPKREIGRSGAVCLPRSAHRDTCRCPLSTELATWHQPLVTVGCARLTPCFEVLWCWWCSWLRPAGAVSDERPQRRRTAAVPPAPRRRGRRGEAGPPA
jgi:hypothetical protein